ncbi:hypothetical protein V6N13_064021 [Hibiscus sabdariffa]
MSPSYPILLEGLLADHKRIEKKKDVDEPLTSIERLGKKGVQMSCSKWAKTCHDKRSCKSQVSGNTHVGPSIVNAPTSNVHRRKIAPTSNVPRRNIAPTPAVRTPKL